jgi:hypothetical protein
MENENLAKKVIKVDSFLQLRKITDYITRIGKHQLDGSIKDILDNVFPNTIMSMRVKNARNFVYFNYISSEFCIARKDEIEDVEISFETFKKLYNEL